VQYGKVVRIDSVRAPDKLPSGALDRE
jgi:hypothetical protein